MKADTFCNSCDPKEPHCQTTLPTRSNTHALSDHAYLPVACHVMSIGTCQRARVKAYRFYRKAARVCCCAPSLPQLMTSLTLCPTLCTRTGGNMSPKNGFMIQEAMHAITHTYMLYIQDTSSTSITSQSHHSIEKAPVLCKNPDASQTATSARAS